MSSPKSTSEETTAPLLFDLAHAMRSPLLTLRGFSELAQDAARDPQNPDDLQLALAAIERSALRLNRLVEDLVNLARLHSPPPPLQPRPLVLEAILEELVREAERGWNLEEVEIALETPGPVPLVCDERCFRIAVSALLRNAVEACGKSGEVVLRLRQDKSATLVEIENEGGNLEPGTSEAEISRLFQAFARGEAQEGVPPGLGLGLHLASEAARSLEATLQLSVGPEGRTRATLRLPPAQKPISA